MKFRRQFEAVSDARQKEIRSAKGLGMTVALNS